MNVKMGLFRVGRTSGRRKGEKRMMRRMTMI
jgi:hypothetical protein